MHRKLFVDSFLEAFEYFSANEIENDELHVWFDVRQVCEYSSMAVQQPHRCCWRLWLNTERSPTWGMLRWFISTQKDKPYTHNQSMKVSVQTNAIDLSMVIWWDFILLNFLGSLNSWSCHLIVDGLNNKNANIYRPHLMCKIHVHQISPHCKDNLCNCRYTEEQVCVIKSWITNSLTEMWYIILIYNKER